MQKKLIALAVAAAAAAPAFAQSNVTIYGAVRVSVDHVDAKAATGDSWRVSDQYSRIGFKGSEDLGGGMKAIWQWESMLNSTNSNNAATNNIPANHNGSQRNTFLGLSGGFGTVLAGTHDSPYKLGGSADLFADTAADAQCGQTGYNGTSGATLTAATNPTCIIGRNGWDNRFSNVLAYISPTWSGFHFAIAGVAGEAPADNNTAADADGLLDGQSYVAVYENGPLKATLGHELGSKEVVNALSTVTTATEKRKATKFNIGYKMGAIGLGYTYEQSTAGLTNTTAGGLVKDKGHLASVSYAMGATTLGLQIGKFDDKGTASGGADPTNTDLKTWTIGAYHALSKRTQAYAGYHNAKFGSGGETNNAKVITMGLNHSF